MSATIPRMQQDERWRFWRDVLVFNLKVLLGNLRDFALIPISLAAALIDVVSKGEREGSLFYRVLRWGAHSEEVLDAYSAIKHEKVTVNPSHTVDAVVSRIEGVVMREYEKGGTAASIKAALDRVIDQVHRGTGGHRERVEGAFARMSDSLGKVKLAEKMLPPWPKATDDRHIISVRPMSEADSATVTGLAAELGYPNEIETIRGRIKAIGGSDLLLVAIDSADRIIGFIQAHRVWIIEVGFRVEILGLVVAKTARRLEVGRKLIAAVEEWATEVSAEAVVVRSNTTRTESHIFYPALGYEKIKVQAVYEKRLRVEAASESSKRP